MSPETNWIIKYNQLKRNPYVRLGLFVERTVHASKYVPLSVFRFLIRLWYKIKRDKQIPMI